jgi:adenylate cyclase class IV
VIEVELKFGFPADARMLLQTKLDAMLAQPLGQADNVDTYYDTASFDCLQQAVFVRIRNHKHLEIKYHEHADPAHMHTVFSASQYGQILSGRLYGSPLR